MFNRMIGAIPGVALVFAVTVLAAAEEPRVAASINPIHSLVAAVMEGAGVPRLIVGGAASPHSYFLRPSDAESLSRAKLVFRIGGEFERFLDKPLASLAGKARVVNLIDVPFMQLQKSGDEHDDSGINPHLWLSPRNARAIVAVAVAELSTLDPGNVGLYRKNGDRLSARLDNLDLEMKLTLDPVSGVPFYVFHDAFQYLVNAYGLNQAGYIALTPERPPGTRRIRETRQQILKIGAKCLFREPQFNSRLVRSIGKGTGIKIDVLDSLGAALEPGPELYFKMMRANAAALVRCLGGG